MSLESFYGGATVFLVTFYRVLPFWLFVILVLFSVLIVSVKMESIEMSLNKCRLVNIFKVQNFLPLKSVKFVCGFWNLGINGR